MIDFRAMAKTTEVKDSSAVKQYARMWPREIFDHVPEDGGNKPLAKSVKFLEEPGVYVLYRDDVPYYVGQADRLRRRLWWHAMRPQARYYNFWNFFSAFVIPDGGDRDEVEGILISAMPTANHAEPKFPKEKFPPEVIKMVRRIRKAGANPTAAPAEKRS